MLITTTLLIAICILNCIDYQQTVYAVSAFGLGVEANPVARILFEMGYEWVKLVIVPAALILLGIIIKIDRRNIWTAWILLATYIAIVTNNFFVLMKMRHLAIVMLT